MNCLEERILKDGIVKEGNVLKVDSFLNHQMDIDVYKRQVWRVPAVISLSDVQFRCGIR